ncbi:Type IV secretory pathway, VirD2 components (relaxase) [Rhizobiales bacterium GAS113]|nr:Type IV secretory pathway, VirD2 components (relaxase) [Rhizobiales bacterium GAS113]
MSRAAQLEWWMGQVTAARRAVGTAQLERRTPRRSGLLDDENRARAGRVTPLPKAPLAHVVLRSFTITGQRDDERFRTLPEVSGRGGVGNASALPNSAKSRIEGGLSGGSGGGAVGRARLLAAGYQPAVIKVISYAHGVARATATGQYVQREEVPVETHDGRMLGDRDAVAAEIKEWSKAFEKRTESQDVVAIRLQLHGLRDTPEARETYEKAIAAGFEGHRHAYRIDTLPSGEIEARLVVAMAGPPKERFRIREERIGTEQDGFNQRRLDAPSEAAVKARIEEVTGYPQHAMSIDPGRTNHGRDGVTWQLNYHIEKGGPLVDDRGRMVANAADARNTAKEWGPSLRSQSPRDTMHLMISAKAGTDVVALTEAARAFLHDRFADHKFMFGIHTDKEADGHIHAHAVITVKNEAGQKIHPNREDFRVWREVYAEHARAQGLRIVATSAMERASSQSYGAKDKAIVDVAERPRPAREARDRAYASDPANQRLIDNARQRIAAARTNPIRLPLSETERHTVNESIVAWSTVAREAPQNEMAQDMLQRLSMAQTIGGILHTLEKRVHHLTSQEDKTMAITSEQMAKDLRAMNEAVSRTTDLLDGETRQQFRESSARYLETLANRIDLQRVQERGVQELSRAEVERVAGIGADRLIERAQEVRAKEEREAAAAHRLADRAVEAERRQEGRTGIDPESQRELKAERAVVAGSQQSAAREAREAAAAVEAARVLAEHPGRPLPNSLIQTDALTKLRAEQERVVREIEGERAESIKGQHMK